MLEDTPGWQAYATVLKGMYAVHPVNISVAGTKQTIAPIDPEVLHICHRAFYSPSNLLLVVCGRYDFDRVTELAQRITPETSAPTAIRHYGTEPEQVVQSYTEKHMAVSRPMFMLGCKDTVPEQQYQRQLIGELAADCVAGRSAPLYRELEEAGLIDQTFGTDYFTFAQGACAFFCGDSRDPQTVREKIGEELRRIARDGLDEAVFLRMKKAAYGSYIRALNDPSMVCRLHTEAFFSGGTCFDFAQTFADITKEQVEQRIAHWAQDGMTSLTVIAPKKEEV